MDELTLKGMSFHARHGVFDEEKVQGNPFEVDLIFGLSLKEAAQSDELKQTLDYATARNLVARVMDGPPVNLIETLAYQIGELVFSRLNPKELTVRVRKLNPPMEGNTQYSEVSMKWPR